MNISIFGLGYVGAVSAGCLAQDGHSVIGVDPYQPKVDLINAGQTPVIEKDIGEIIAKAVAEGRLRATRDVAEAIKGSEISLICVGTPSQHNGSLDLKYVRAVCEEIGLALKEKDAFHVVVARSTMLPGSTEKAAAAGVPVVKGTDKYKSYKRQSTVATASNAFLTNGDHVVF